MMNVLDIYELMLKNNPEASPIDLQKKVLYHYNMMKKIEDAANNGTLLNGMLNFDVIPTTATPALPSLFSSASSPVELKPENIKGIVQDIYNKYKADPQSTLGKEKIICGLCGKPHTVLKVHLKDTHRLEAWDYCKLMGLPFETTLCSKDFSEEKKAKMDKNWESGKMGKRADKAAKKKSTASQPAQEQVATNGAENASTPSQEPVAGLMLHVTDPKHSQVTQKDKTGNSDDVSHDQGTED